MQIMDVHVELIIAIGIPALTAVVFIVSYFIKKSQCFELMKHRLKAEEEETDQGKKTHREIFERLSRLEKNYSGMDAKIDILLKRLD